MSLPNDTSKAAENNVTIDGYVDDFTSENYKTYLTGELHISVSFFVRKMIYIYDLSYISITIANFH